MSIFNNPKIKNYFNKFLTKFYKILLLNIQLNYKRFILKKVLA